jgi:DNA-directed RNA polymerase subunit RPC12/RpoP
VLAIVAWVLWLVAAGLFVTIAGLGLVFLRGIASSRAKETIEPEDVAELDVFFVCAECGTEFQVTRLGEVQVPRHCGEPMVVVRRPRVIRSNN